MPERASEKGEALSRVGSRSVGFPHITRHAVISLIVAVAIDSFSTSSTTMAHSHHHHHHHHHGHDATSHYPKQNYGAGAKWIKNLTKDRLATFNGGHFADVNLASVLYTHRIDDENHVKLQVWSAPGLEKPLFEEAMKQKFKPAKKGDSFGPSCE